MKTGKMLTYEVTSSACRWRHLRHYATCNPVSLTYSFEAFWKLVEKVLGPKRHSAPRQLTTTSHEDNAMRLETRLGFCISTIDGALEGFQVSVSDLLHRVNIGDQPNTKRTYAGSTSTCQCVQSFKAAHYYDAMFSADSRKTRLRDRYRVAVLYAVTILTNSFYLHATVHRIPH